MAVSAILNISFLNSTNSFFLHIGYISVQCLFTSLKSGFFFGGGGGAGGVVVIEKEYFVMLLDTLHGRFIFDRVKNIHPF